MADMHDDDFFQVASLKLREKAASSVNFGAADKLAAHGY